MPSFLITGGTSSTLPDTHRFPVDTWHYMMSGQLNTMYIISQAAPGPNVLFVELLGRQMVGLDGAIVSLVDICGSSCVITAVIARVIDCEPDARWTVLARRGLAPFMIGLLFSTGWVFACDVNSSFSTIALAVATVLVRSFTRIHPLALMGLGALVGGTGWMQRPDRPACKNQSGHMSASFVGSPANETTPWPSGISQCRL